MRIIICRWLLRFTDLSPTTAAKHGETPCHVAAVQGNTECLKVISIVYARTLLVLGRCYILTSGCISMQAMLGADLKGEICVANDNSGINMYTAIMGPQYTLLLQCNDVMYYCFRWCSIFGSSCIDLKAKAPCPHEYHLVHMNTAGSVMISHREYCKQKCSPLVITSSSCQEELTCWRTICNAVLCISVIWDCNLTKHISCTCLGFTPLHLAIVKSRNEMAKILISELGVRGIGAVNESGITAAHVAASAGL